MEKRKIETSKLILLVLFIFSTVFVLFNMYLSYLNHSTSVMEVIADGLFKLFTISVGFYYWKAKNENINKGRREREEENRLRERNEREDNNYQREEYEDVDNENYYNSYSGH